MLPRDTGKTVKLLSRPDHVCQVISWVGVLVIFWFPIHRQGVIVIPAMIQSIVSLFFAAKGSHQLWKKICHHHHYTDCILTSNYRQAQTKSANLSEHGPSLRLPSSHTAEYRIMKNYIIRFFLLTYLNI